MKKEGLILGLQGGPALLVLAAIAGRRGDPGPQVEQHLKEAPSYTCPIQILCCLSQKSCPFYIVSYYMKWPILLGRTVSILYVGIKISRFTS